MRKILITSAIALATTVFVPAANAGGSHGAEDIAAEDFVRVRRTRLSYNIDHETCQVALKTTRNIRRITQRDPYGNIIKRWSSKSGERVRLFGDFSKFALGLTEGTLKVKTGYKNRVKFQEIGDQFRADLISCFTKDRDLDPVDPAPVDPAPVDPAPVDPAPVDPAPVDPAPVDPVDPPVTPVVTCPVEENINALFAAAGNEAVGVSSTVNNCTVFFGTSTVGIFNGLSADNGNMVGASVNTMPAPVDEFGNPVELSPEQLGACAAAIGAGGPTSAVIAGTGGAPFDGDLGDLCADFVPSP